MRPTLAIVCVLFSVAAASAIPAALSAADAEDTGRVEFPRAGFAVTFPEGWRLEAAPTPATMLQVADYLWAGESCWVLWAPGSVNTAEAAVQLRVDRTEANGEVPPVSTPVKLPVGDVTRLDYQESGFLTTDYLIDADLDGLAVLSCYSRTPPDDRWLPIAQTIEAMPPETAAGINEPPVSRFEFDSRVELPASGFAIDFPAEWQVLGASDSPFGVDEVRVVLDAWTDGDSCRVLDSSALRGSSGDHALESMHESLLEELAARGWRVLDATDPELPSGRSGRVVYGISWRRMPTIRSPTARRG